MAELEPPHGVASSWELKRLPVGRPILHLKSWNQDSLPALASMERGGARLLALGPGEWLLISHSRDGVDSCRAFAARARAQGVAAVDMSDGLAGLQLSGTAAPEVLSTACGLDLHPTAFPPGASTSTRLANLRVVIECTARLPTYELHVGASYLPYLDSWLRDAASIIV